MLNNKRFTIMADTTIDETKIASYGAVLNIDTMDLSLTSRYINEEACKEHKDTVRADRASFEDFAYSIQDLLKNGEATL